MSPVSSVELQEVAMCYRRSQQQVDTLKERVIRTIQRRTAEATSFWVLRDISFCLEPGESLGVIGVNGAGKSTLLKLIAGVLTPTAGQVTVRGRVVPLIELGAGFDIELTALENIFLNGAMLGYSRKFMRQHLKDIVDFSELQGFMEMPLKNYSSGMLARLGFSISTISQPDILILDEVLAVGDFKFQRKCQDRLQELRRGDVTLLFVSHNAEQVAANCQKALWLEQGKIKMLGPATEVCAAYKASG